MSETTTVNTRRSRCTRRLTTACIASGLLLAATPSAAADDYRVLLAAAAGSQGMNAPQFPDVQQKLMDTGRFSAVDLFDATQGTPSLALLLEYDGVMTWSNADFHDPEALGDVLADYADTGGAVVITPFATTTRTPNRSLRGRWDRPRYNLIMPRGGTATGHTTLGAIEQPDHPIMQGVSNLESGSGGYRPAAGLLTNHAEVVARWDDGSPLIVVSSNHPNRVDLGLYPPSSDLASIFWVVGTDGDVIMANSLIYAIGGTTGACIADWNGDGEVDINDFFGYLADFESGTPRADLNNDGEIDINDFFIFLQEFEEGC